MQNEANVLRAEILAVRAKNTALVRELREWEMGRTRCKLPGQGGLQGQVSCHSVLNDHSACRTPLLKTADTRASPGYRSGLDCCTSIAAASGIYVVPACTAIPDADIRRRDRSCPGPFAPNAIFTPERHIVICHARRRDCSARGDSGERSSSWPPCRGIRMWQRSGSGRLR